MKTTLLLLFISINCFSQIKIDNVTIPDSVFIEYAKFCENNYYDTIVNIYEHQLSCEMGFSSYSEHEFDLFEKERYCLDKIKIKDFYECKNGIYYHFYILKRKMTGDNFLDWYITYLNK